MDVWWTHAPHFTAAIHATRHVTVHASALATRPWQWDPPLLPGLPRGSLTVTVDRGRPGCPSRLSGLRAHREGVYVAVAPVVDYHGGTPPLHAVLEPTANRCYCCCSSVARATFCPWRGTAICGACALAWLPCYLGR